jgi:DtxR family Mn-dependent transcriptional regulator
VKPGPERYSAAVEDYLKVIHALEERAEGEITTSRLAERLGVSASSVSGMVRKLCELGLLEHPRYGGIAFTETGRRVALGVVRRHRLIESYLVAELGYRWDEVHDEAEVLEHAVSDRMLDRIDAKLGHPTRDPHGDPIPAANGQVPTPDARQLSVCQNGDAGTVARISDSDPEMLRYFDSVGISLDSRLRVLARRDFAGMISVAVEGPVGSESPATVVDLGSPAAEAIWVVA